MPAMLAAGAIGSAVIGSAGAYFSGKSAAEQSERNYKHRYQWQMNDMRKAGLNPMLAFSQGAGQPAQTSFPNIGEHASQAFSAYQGMKLQKEQMELTRNASNKTAAEGRATEIANTIAEASQEYQDAVKAEGGLSATSAKRFELEFAGKEAIIANAKADLETKGLQQRLMTQTYDWNRDIQPLLKQEQEYINRAKAAGLPELEAAAAFWTSIGASGKVLEAILDIIPGGAAIANLLVKKKVLVGKEKTITRAKGYEHTQESYDYR